MGYQRFALSKEAHIVYPVLPVTIIQHLLASKKEYIPLRILSYPVRVVLRRIKVLPYASWKDMLISLIPPPIHDLCQVWIIVRTFEVRVILGH